jgi:hypothetical protein
MTLQDQVKQTFDTYFYIRDGKAFVDGHGLVHATGIVRSRGFFPGGRLPVQFHLAGDLNLSSSGLTTLEGCPPLVTGRFDASDNPLTHLQGGPKIASQAYDVRKCKLSSLAGVPDRVGSGGLLLSVNKLSSLQGLANTHAHHVYVNLNPLQSLQHLPPHIPVLGLSWREDLPVLALVAQKQPTTHVTWLHPSAPPDFLDILDKYIHKGWQWVVPCARELIKAGFKGNARL